MQVVILAGGLGTRLMEETTSRPKPMVEIGGRPIIWHIMKYYEYFGYSDFVICLGYKADFIKDYFIRYFYNYSNIIVDVSDNSIEVINPPKENFRIKLIDTGLNTNTAGRIKRVLKYIDGEEFMLTYGDGLSNVDINELLLQHRSKNAVVTLTTIKNSGRFGNLRFDENGVIEKFVEKPEGDNMWINGGFFVVNKKIEKYLTGDVDDVQWERGPLVELASDRNLCAYTHYGFWKAMDALRDKIELEDIWNSGNAPWKLWEENY